MTRRAARSPQTTLSKSNLKQISLALQNFHDSQRFFPNNGGDGSYGSPNPASHNPGVATFGAGWSGPYYWGYASPTDDPARQHGSYAYAILPYLEQANLYQVVDPAAAISAFYIPARRDALPQPVPADDPIYPGWKYIVPQNSPNSWARTDYAANDQVILPAYGENWGRTMRFADLSDGSSNTLLVGEKALDQEAMNSGSWYWDEPIVVGGAGGTAR